MVWVKPGLVASIDETRVATAGDKEKGGKTIGQKWDSTTQTQNNGECLTYKGNKSASFMGGEYADFTPTPTQVVLNCGETMNPDWFEKGVPGCRYHCNEKGSFTEKIFCDYIKSTLHPDMQKDGVWVSLLILMMKTVQSNV